MVPNEKTRLHCESDPSSGCSPKTKLERRLVGSMFLVVVAGIGLCVMLAAYYRSEYYRTKNAHFYTCMTKECITTASNLLKSIDFDEEPCEDFYSFACGNWIKNSFLVGDMVVSQFSRLNTIIVLRIKEFLELERPNLSEHEKKIKNFYHACLNRQSKDNEANKALLEDLESFGGWPLLGNDWNVTSFDWVNLIEQLYKKGYPHDMLLSIGVDMDIKNTSRSLLVVNQPSLGLQERGYYLLTKDTIMTNYIKLILNLAYYFNPTLDLKKGMIAADYAVTIEKYLAQAMTPNVHERSPEDFYNIMTLVEIEEFSPKIPWRSLLKKLLVPNETINNETRLMVVSPSFLKLLNQLLEELDNPAGKEFLANYILYRTVLFAAEHMGKDLFTIVEDNLRHSAHRDLWQVCVSSVVDFFHMSLTATYAESYMDNETKTLLDTLFRDIQVSLLNDIKAAQWLDEATKEKALQKILKAKSAIAYRDEMLNETLLNEFYSPIDIGENHFNNVKESYKFYAKENYRSLSEERVRFKWTDTSNLLTANAFYQPTQNSIIVPIGLLQDTFFSKGRPHYVNYGSLGTILGHEYTHAFDSTGSLYDEEGNYDMWWSKKSWKNFKERTQCFVEQYNKYYEPTVDTHLNGTMTLGENLADNGGLLAAYHAYTTLLEQIEHEEKLPGLPFTEKQMFWISYASAWCRKQSNFSLRYTMENSVHSPAKFRVIGALSNLAEFSRDFGCGKDTPLNPPCKCHFWK